MKKIQVFGVVLAFGAALALLPAAVSAQDNRPKATPTARPAPAARPAPLARPAAVARPAPAARIAPSRPAPAARIAPQRAAPAARIVPSRPAPTARIMPQRAAPQRGRQTPAINRAVQQHERTRAVQSHDRAVQRTQRSAPQAASKAATAAPTQTRAQLRTQQRAERTLLRQEDRALRNTPRSRRAAKREEIQRAREQRAQQRQQQAAPNAAVTTRAAIAQQTRAQRRAARHAAGAAVTPQAARAGRFASRFASRAQSDPNLRSDPIAAHRAWHNHHRAGFVAWYGPVFWPYAYSDIFDYAFWPYGYDDGYWDYAYDNFIDGLFWGEHGPPEDYAYAYAPSSGLGVPRVSHAGVQELCKEPGTGVTAWPFADIQRKVGLNDEQKQLLGEVRKAAADAAATFKASCPAENTFPLTPPGRLTAMTGRLQATFDAVTIVRPALDKFYNSLSDEQKERFNQLGPKRPADNPEMTAALPHNGACSEAKPGLATLPIEKIEDVVKPTDAQLAEFKKLQDATDKAVATLQAACPDETPLTPPGRLQAIETRLQAMIDAATTVKPALEGFYASLSSEQKARFDRIGEEVAQTTSSGR